MRRDRVKESLDAMLRRLQKNDVSAQQLSVSSDDESDDGDVGDHVVTAAPDDALDDD